MHRPIDAVASTMRALIIGGTGYTGGNIARELTARGHEAVLRSGSTEPSLNIFDADAVAEAARDADAVVMAVSPLTDRGRLADALPGLLAAAEGKRLGIVGGASSLHRTEGGELVLETIPDEWRPGVEALIEVKQVLEASGTDVDWFYLSPAEQYGAYTPGERRGVYRTDTDVLVVEEGSGVSHIGGEDYAIAFVDELEDPKHHRMRFTVGY